MKYEIGQRVVAENFVVTRWTVFRGLGSVSEEGGAISASLISNLVVRYCLFEEDVAMIGGGIFAQNCTVNVFSTCFLSCRGSKISTNDGGNAITFSYSPIFVEYVSACKCAPELSPCGDGILNGVNASIWALNLNNSYCKGTNGECSIGIIEKTNSTVKFMNSMSCTQLDLICMPEGKVYDSNFVDNNVGYLIYGLYGSISLERCCFFGNTKDIDDLKTNKYVYCYGDINRNGVKKFDYTFTNYILRVEQNRCIFEYLIKTEVKFNTKFVLHLSLYLLVF